MLIPSMNAVRPSTTSSLRWSRWLTSQVVFTEKGIDRIEFEHRGPGQSANAAGTLRVPPGVYADTRTGRTKRRMLRQATARHLFARAGGRAFKEGRTGRMQRQDREKP